MRYHFVQKRFTRERGVTLWLVILILGMALAASLGASALVLGEIQQTRIITDSVTAFFAADAGSEQALYQLCKQNNKNDQPAQPVGAAQYSYRVLGGAGNRYVVATGSFRNSRRAIELTGFAESGGVVDCGVAGTPVAGSPLSRWRMDENADGTCADGKDVCDSADGNHGTNVGTTIAVGGGISGNARSFNGANRYLNVGNIGISNLNAFTVEGWFKTGTTLGAVYAEGNTSNALPVLEIYVESNRKLAAFIRDDSWVSGTIKSSGVVADNTWHHFAFVQSAKNSRTLYLDGVLDNTNATNIGTLSVSNSSIGILRRSAFSEPFSGSIDEVALYDMALSAAQVCDDYKAASGRTSCP